MVRQDVVYGAPTEGMSTTARAGPVGWVGRVRQPIALVAPAPARLRPRGGGVHGRCDDVVGAADADMGATGCAARLAVVAEQLAAAAVAPLVLPDVGLLAGLPVEAENVVHAAREGVLAAGLAHTGTPGQAFAFVAPTPGSTFISGWRGG